MRSVQISEGEHVAVARLPTEVLGVALDAVEERRRELRVDLRIRRAQVLGEDRGGRAVGDSDVLDRRAVAGALRMVVDHDVRLLEALGRIVAEDVRLDVDEDERVELREFVGCDHADFDAHGRTERLVFGPPDFAERDQRRGRALAPEQVSEGVRARDPVGVGVGLEQDAQLLTRREQLADLHDALEIREVIELFVDVVADQRLPAGAAQRRVIRQILLGQAVGEDQDRGVLVDLPNLAHREPRPRAVVADQGELVVGGRIELGDRFVVQPALQHPESDRPRARLIVTRNPGEFFGRVRADAAPQSSALGSIADDDSTSQRAHPMPRRCRARGPARFGGRSASGPGPTPRPDRRRRADRRVGSGGGPRSDRSREGTASRTAGDGVAASIGRGRPKRSARGEESAGAPALAARRGRMGAPRSGPPRGYVDLLRRGPSRGYVDLLRRGPPRGGVDRRWNGPRRVRSSVGGRCARCGW